MPPHLLLHGATGTGKTRTAWLLAWVNKRGDIFGMWKNQDTRFVKGVDFSEKVVQASLAGKDGLTEFLDPLRYADLLILDDIDKARFSPRVESTFFGLLDFRIENQDPMILTLNSSASGFQRLLSKDTGPAIVRRIREFFLPVHFTNETRRSPDS